MLSRRLLSKLLTPMSYRAFSSNVRNLSVNEVSKSIENLAANEGDSESLETVNEYFRHKFRKLDFDDAWALLKKVSDVQALEDSFWVWETLEEAIRPQIPELPLEKAYELEELFGKMLKGSSYLIDDFIDRRYGDTKIY